MVNFGDPDNLSLWFARIDAMPGVQEALRLAETRLWTIGKGDMDEVLSENAAVQRRERGRTTAMGRQRPRVRRARVRGLPRRRMSASSPFGRQSPDPIAGLVRIRSEPLDPKRPRRV